MSSHKDRVFEECWPVAQSLILARAPIDAVAKALKADTLRLDRQGRPWSWRLKNWRKGGLKSTRYEWVHVPTLQELFTTTQPFTNLATVTYAIPTNSDWTVIWDNSAQCIANDTLPWRLTNMYGMETIEFYSTDRNSTQLAGTSFNWRRKSERPDEEVVRNVYCCNQGSRWHFEQHGDLLPEEDGTQYTARRKRDRLNEEVLMGLLDRLGARPWREDYYDLENSKCFRVTDAINLPHCEQSSLKEIRERIFSDSPEPSVDFEEAYNDDLRKAPDYAADVCVPASATGPSALLENGEWCGHGEPEFKVFDIRKGDCTEFTVQLAVSESDLNGNPPFAAASTDAKEAAFPIYDSRKHPGSVYVDSGVQPALQGPFTCSECQKQHFRLAVGFAIHPESSSRNDTSWFALAARCANCGHSDIISEDETS